MKKIISVILAVLMVVSIMPLPVFAEEATRLRNVRLYEDFLFSDLIPEYGVAQNFSEEDIQGGEDLIKYKIPSSAKGINSAFIEDFNNDNKEEMIIVRTECSSSYEWTVYVDLYVINNNVVRFAENIYYTSKYDNAGEQLHIYTIKNNNKFQLCIADQFCYSSGGSIHAAYFYVYEINNVSELIYDILWHYKSGNVIYRINGTEYQTRVDGLSTNIEYSTMVLLENTFSEMGIYDVKYSIGEGYYINWNKFSQNAYAKIYNGGVYDTAYGTDYTDFSDEYAVNDQIIDSGFSGHNQKWILYTSGELVISGSGETRVSGDVVDSIPWYDYYDQITTVTIKADVTDISPYSFCGENMTSFYVENGNNYYSSDENGILFDKDKTVLLSVPVDSHLTEYTVPSSATEIYGCAFQYNNNLTEVVIPEGVTIINHDTFSVSNIESIYIPVSVKDIDWWAFSGCEKLETVFYAGTEEQWNDIYVEIGNEVLDNVSVIPNSTKNETDNNTFGWPIINTKDSFGYEKKHYIDLAYYYSSIKSYNLNTFYGSILGLDGWSGSCFGLSLLSVADYNGQIDLSAYFDKSGNSLNEFGYEAIDKVTTKKGTGNAYVLTGNDAIIELIERAQVSQYSYSIEATEVFGVGYGLINFVNHCRNNSTPLLISLVPESHTVSTDPTKPVEEYGKDIYKIWLYDSKAPRISKQIENQNPIYNYEQSYLLIDVNNDRWAYCYNGVLGDWYDKIPVMCKTIKFYDISKLESSFFFSDLQLIDDAVVINMSELCTFKIENINEVIFALTKDGYQIKNDLVDYIPYLKGESGDDNSVSGCLKLPEGEYTFITDDRANFTRFIGEDYVVCFNANDGLTVVFDDENKEVKVINTSDNTVDFEFGIENIKNDSADIISGKIEPQKEIIVEYDVLNDNGVHNVITSSDLSKITTTFITDGKITESQYHKSDCGESGHLKSNWIIDIVATCSTDGKKHIECSICGEVLQTEKISKAKHKFTQYDIIKEATSSEKGIWEKVCTVCGEKSQREFEYNYPVYSEYPFVISTPETVNVGDEFEVIVSYEKLIGEREGFFFFWYDSDILEYVNSEFLFDVDTAMKGSDLVFNDANTISTYFAYTNDSEIFSKNLIKFKFKAISSGIVNFHAEQYYDFDGYWGWGKDIPLPGDAMLTVNENHQHSFIGTETPPTCTEQGYIAYTCSCGESYREYTIDATGHTPGLWEVVVEAQVGIDGLEQQKCTVCGEVLDERVIPALPDVSYMTGDANGDGKITAADARIALRISAKVDSLEKYNLTAAVLDVTGDGKLTAADARKILRIAAKIE